MRKRKILSEDALQNNPISTEEVAVTVADIRRELEAYADPVKREYLPRFFKTGKGQYGEGDKFLGVILRKYGAFCKIAVHFYLLMLIYWLYF